MAAGARHERGAHETVHRRVAHLAERLARQLVEHAEEAVARAGRDERAPAQRVGHARVGVQPLRNRPVPAEHAAEPEAEAEERAAREPPPLAREEQALRVGDLATFAAARQIDHRDVAQRHAAQQRVRLEVESQVFGGIDAQEVGLPSATGREAG